MKAANLHIHFGHWRPDDQHVANGTVMVPGLGAVEMKDVLSSETLKALETELLAVCRMRLTGKLQELPPEIQEQAQ